MLFLYVYIIHTRKKAGGALRKKCHVCTRIVNSGELITCSQCKKCFHVANCSGLTEGQKQACREHASLWKCTTCAGPGFDLEKIANASKLCKIQESLNTIIAVMNTIPELKKSVEGIK